MSFHFDANKVAQATACMLKSMDEKRHNFMALLKMLYIADRESLKETGSATWNPVQHKRRQCII